MAELITESGVTSMLRAEAARIDSISKSGEVFLGGRSTSRSLVQRYVLAGDSSVIKSIILGACFRSEKLGPGSADILLEIFPIILRNSLASSAFNFKQKVNQVKDLRTSLDEKRILFARKTCREIIQIEVERLGAEARPLVERALEIGNPFSTFKTARSNLEVSTVSKRDGYNFYIESPVSAMTGKSGSWNRKDCDVVVIDGIIEKVSELHHLLEVYSASKRPLCIICRDAIGDVRTTIRHNNLRGTIDVCLVTFGYDEVRANLLVDAAVCSGCDVVSSLQGDLISSALSKVTTVDRVTASDSCTTIFNARSMKSVLDHRLRIEGKMQESDPLVSQYLEKRLSSLMSDVVQIEVGSDALRTNPGTMEEIDAFFRRLGAYISSGYFTREDMLDDLQVISVFKGIESCSLPEILPASSFLCLVRFTQQLLVDLIATGAIVKT